MPGLLKGLVLDVNYTIMNTQTKYPFFEAVIVGHDSTGFHSPIYGQEYNTRKGPMEDQPASILNIILGWDYKGFSSRISYRYQAKTVESLDTRWSAFDSYYSTFSLWDLMLNQKITKNISCYANLTNIGNHIDEYYFGSQHLNLKAIPEGHSLQKIQSQLGNALPTRSEFYGFRAQVGVKISL
jgi:hypothetical protein